MLGSSAARSGKLNLEMSRFGRLSFRFGRLKLGRLGVGKLRPLKSKCGKLGRLKLNDPQLLAGSAPDSAQTG